MLEAQVWHVEAKFLLREVGKIWRRIAWICTGVHLEIGSWNGLCLHVQDNRLVANLEYSENQQDSEIHHCEKFLSTAFRWSRLVMCFYYEPTDMSNMMVRLETTALKYWLPAHWLFFVGFCVFFQLLQVCRSWRLHLNCCSSVSTKFQSCQMFVWYLRPNDNEYLILNISVAQTVDLSVKYYSCNVIF